jgi:hypothetical protein
MIYEYCSNSIIAMAALVRIYIAFQLGKSMNLLPHYGC